MMSAGTQAFEQTVAPFLDGALAQSASQAAVEVTNPSNGRYAFSIPAGCDADVERAVASARRTFESRHWSEAPPQFRKKVLHRWADLIAIDATTLDALDAGEMGKPVREAFGNATAAADLMRFCAEAVDKITGDVYVSDLNSLIVQRRVPRGVVAAVVPWNFPAYNAVLKVGPALAEESNGN
jgi:acyl-CoA reductase-like NAD-dependent aldehyde dehydrogenase